ncbi:hypothetical protein FRB98_009626 [Tulasnella sp. 332]|nr:hypothetical protein FRB98_009626 [Tulasnella sp. 332]
MSSSMAPTSSNRHLYPHAQGTPTSTVHSPRLPADDMVQNEAHSSAPVSSSSDYSQLMHHTTPTTFDDFSFNQIKPRQSATLLQRLQSPSFSTQQDLQVGVDVEMTPGIDDDEESSSYQLQLLEPKASLLHRMSGANTPVAKPNPLMALVESQYALQTSGVNIRTLAERMQPLVPRARIASPKSQLIPSGPDFEATRSVLGHLLSPTSTQGGSSIAMTTSCSQEAAVDPSNVPQTIAMTSIVSAITTESSASAPIIISTPRITSLPAPEITANSAMRLFSPDPYAGTPYALPPPPPSFEVEASHVQNAWGAQQDENLRTQEAEVLRTFEEAEEASRRAAAAVAEAEEKKQKAIEAKARLEEEIERQKEEVEARRRNETVGVEKIRARDAQIEVEKATRKRKADEEEERQAKLRKTMTGTEAPSPTTSVSALPHEPPVQAFPIPTLIEGKIVTQPASRTTSRPSSASVALKSVSVTPAPPPINETHVTQTTLSLPNITLRPSPGTRSSTPLTASPSQLVSSPARLPSNTSKTFTALAAHHRGAPNASNVKMESCPVAPFIKPEPSSMDLMASSHERPSLSKGSLDVEGAAIESVMKHEVERLTSAIPAQAPPLEPCDTAMISPAEPSASLSKTSERRSGPPSLASSPAMAQPSQMVEATAPKAPVIPKDSRGRLLTKTSAPLASTIPVQDPPSRPPSYQANLPVIRTAAKRSPERPPMGPGFVLGENSNGTPPSSQVSASRTGANVARLPNATCVNNPPPPMFTPVEPTAPPAASTRCQALTEKGPTLVILTQNAPLQRQGKGTSTEPREDSSFASVQRNQHQNAETSTQTTPTLSVSNSLDGSLTRTVDPRRRVASGPASQHGLSHNAPTSTSGQQRGQKPSFSYDSQTSRSGLQQTSRQTASQGSPPPSTAHQRHRTNEDGQGAASPVFDKPAAATPTHPAGSSVQHKLSLEKLRALGDHGTNDGPASAGSTYHPVAASPNMIPLGRPTVRLVADETYTMGRLRRADYNISTHTSIVDARRGSEPPQRQERLRKDPTPGSGVYPSRVPGPRGALAVPRKENNTAGSSAVSDTRRDQLAHDREPARRESPVPQVRKRVRSEVLHQRASSSWPPPRSPDLAEHPSKRRREDGYMATSPLLEQRRGDSGDFQLGGRGMSYPDQRNVTRFPESMVGKRLGAKNMINADGLRVMHTSLQEMDPSTTNMKTEIDYREILIAPYRRIHGLRLWHGAMKDMAYRIFRDIQLNGPLSGGESIRTFLEVEALRHFRGRLSPHRIPQCMEGMTAVEMSTVHRAPGFALRFDYIHRHLLPKVQGTLTANGSQYRLATTLPCDQYTEAPRTREVEMKHHPITHHHHIQMNATCADRLPLLDRHRARAQLRQRPFALLSYLATYLLGE